MSMRAVDRGDEGCGDCPHPFGPHVFVATGTRPLDGGLVICPAPGCECVAAWGTNGAKGAGWRLVPEARDILRRHVQAPD